MKTFLKTLKTKKAELEKKLEQRTDFFSNQPHSWCISDEGDKYINKSSDLDFIRENLENTINSIENYLHPNCDSSKYTTCYHWNNNESGCFGCSKKYKQKT